MITQTKMKIYKKYSGDIDHWVRVGRKTELNAIEDEDWGQIDGFIQDLHLIENGLASEGFKLEVYEKLKKSCDNKDTYNLIIGYNKKSSKKKKWWKF